MSHDELRKVGYSNLTLLFFPVEIIKVVLKRSQILIRSKHKMIQEQITSIFCAFDFSHLPQSL